MNKTRAYPFCEGLTVCLDFEHPQAWLALHPIETLLRELNLNANWLPLRVPPLQSPPELGDKSTRGELHRHFRAVYQAQDIQRYAHARGLKVDRMYQSAFRDSGGEPGGNPAAAPAALGLLWCRLRKPESQLSYLHRAFHRYWQAEDDIQTMESISDLLSESGVPLDGIEDYCVDSGPTELEHLQNSLKKAGIFKVPALVLQQNNTEPEVFFGREHLPMLRWQLSGKMGHPPI